MRKRLVGLTLILSTLTPSSVYAQESANMDGWAHRLIRERSTEPRQPLPPIPETRANQLRALRIFAERGEWEDDDWNALLDLWQKESGWRHWAKNSNTSARGIPQAMGSLYPETMAQGWIDDPEAQIQWGMDYIANRYGTPSRALEKWLWRKENDRRGGWY